MKKIFTLLFTVGLFTLAQAQPGTRDNRQTDRRDDQPAGQRTDQRTDQWDRNNGYDDQREVAFERNNPYDNDNRFNNGIMAPNRKRDMEIARVNREFNQRIQQIRYSYFMNRWEKQKRIQFLENKRQREIRMIYIKYSSRRDRFDDHDNGNRRY
jgi:Ni/Co efflux regulator RcnB